MVKIKKFLCQHFLYNFSVIFTRHFTVLCYKAVYTSIMARGALILIEGVDRAGKTTQTELLLDNLKKRGRSVELIKFPGRFLSSIMTCSEILTI